MKNISLHSILLLFTLALPAVAAEREPIQKAYHQVLSSPSFAEAKSELAKIGPSVDRYELDEIDDLFGFLDELSENFHPGAKSLATLAASVDPILDAYLARAPDAKVVEDGVKWIARTRPTADFAAALRRLEDRIVLEWHHHPDVSSDHIGIPVVEHLRERNATEVEIVESLEILIRLNAWSPVKNLQLTRTEDALYLLDPLPRAVRPLVVRKCLYMLDILPGGYARKPETFEPSWEIEWIQDAYAHLPRAEAYAFTFDLVSRFGRSSDAGDPWASVNPEFWEDMRDKVPLEDYLSLLDGFLPLTDLKAGHAPWYVDGARKSVREILNHLREKGASAETLAAVSARAEERIARELATGPTGSFRIPPFVRFFAEARVGARLSHEEKEGNYNLVRDQADHDSWFLKRYVRGEWVEVAYLETYESVQEIQKFRWRLIPGLRRLIGLEPTS